MSEAFTSHDEKLFKSNYRKLGAQGMVLNANRVNKFRAGFVFVGILDDKGVKKCHTNQPFRPLRHWENFASCHVWLDAGGGGGGSLHVFSIRAAVGSMKVKRLSEMSAEAALFFSSPFAVRLMNLFWSEAGKWDFHVGCSSDDCASGSIVCGW